MTVKLTEFNLIDFLQDDTEIAEYLEEAFRDTDPNVFMVALGHVIKSKGGIDTISKKAGMSRTSLYKTINGTTKPKWETVHKLLNALHLTFKVA